MFPSKHLQWWGGRTHFNRKRTRAEPLPRDRQGSTVRQEQKIIERQGQNYGTEHTQLMICSNGTQTHQESRSAHRSLQQLNSVIAQRHLIQFKLQALSPKKTSLNLILNFDMAPEPRLGVASCGIRKITMRSLNYYIKL